MKTSAIRRPSDLGRSLGQALCIRNSDFMSHRFDDASFVGDSGLLEDNG